MGSKSGKQYAVENQKDAQQWSEEPEAEGQETWNEEAWPNQDGQWEEQTGEQGHLCCQCWFSTASTQAERTHQVWEGVGRRTEGVHNGKDLEAPWSVLEHAIQVGLQSKLLWWQVLLWVPALQAQRFWHSISIQSASTFKGWHSWTSRPKTKWCLGERPLWSSKRTQTLWTLGSKDWQPVACQDWRLATGFNTFESRHREEQRENEEGACCKEATC